jgi:uncharacterized protein YdhG (YjbR/CyaY superfamily)
LGFFTNQKVGSSTLSGRNIFPLKTKRAKWVLARVAGEIQQSMTTKKTLRQGENVTVAKRKSSEVDEYIARCPKEAQGDLAKTRAAIRAAAPGATERTDYFQMPGYSYPGFDYDGMFVWFSFKKPHIRLHVRPPVIQEHRKELAGYVTTKAIVSFPMSKPVPMTLVKKLVKASLKAMKDKSK